MKLFSSTAFLFQGGVVLLDAGRLLSLVNELTGTPFSSYVYTNDGVGNRETMTDLDGLHNYTYDDLYRLSNADHPQPQYPDNDESFTYDGVGNRLTSAGYPTWSYDDNNRLTSYNGTTYTYKTGELCLDFTFHV